MQQEGVAFVFLPQVASHIRASVLPCVEAPMCESTVLVADAGCSPRVPLELLCWEGVGLWVKGATASPHHSSVWTLLPCVALPHWSAVCREAG